MTIKVIGAGLGRTGTLSLKYALEQLGYTKCFHMMELVNNPERLAYWQTLHNKGTTDFNAMFSGYEACVDYPSASFYQILHQYYPEAKVILTLRDPEDWYESVLRTLYAVSPKNTQDYFMFFCAALGNTHLRKISPVLQFANKLIWKEQFKGKFTDKSYALEIYKAWNMEVQRVIPKDQLLIFNPQEGWNNLCAFLSKPIPNTPFPKSNERTDFKTKVNSLMKTGILSL